MTGSRIFGIVWVILALIYYIASDSWLALVILVLTAGLAVYLPVSVLTGSRLLKFSLFLEEEKMKKQPADCRVQVKNRSLLPLAKAKVTVSFHNILTGEQEAISAWTSIPGRGRDELLWHFTSRYAGQTQVTVQTAVVYDFLGIFCRGTKAGLSKSMLVTPETFYCAVDISNRNAPNMDSDYYSDSRKGFDSGETFGIREYMPGDSIKFIHWKLSSKLDKTLIRELGFPIQNSILILLETGWAKEPITSATADSMAEAFLSLSQSLAASQMDHYVCWFDHREALLKNQEITDQESVGEVMKTLLCAPMAQDDNSVIFHYLHEFREFHAAHVVYITCAVNPDEIQPLLAGCCLTILKCVAEDMPSEDDYLPSGITLVPFYEETIREDLCQLNI